MCCVLNRADTHNCPHLLFEPAKSRSFLLAVVNLALGMPLTVPFSNARDKGILLFLGFDVHGTLRNNLQQQFYHMFTLIKFTFMAAEKISQRFVNSCDVKTKTNKKELAPASMNDAT